MVLHLRRFMGGVLVLRVNFIGTRGLWVDLIISVGGRE